MNPGKIGRQGSSYLGWGFAAGLGLVLLTGCAGGPRGIDGGTHADLVTPSDESDIRRRARIRMELAAS